MPSKSGRCKCCLRIGEGEKKGGRQRRKEGGPATLQAGTGGVSDCQSKKWCPKPKDCAWEAAGGLMGLSAHYPTFIQCKL